MPEHDIGCIGCSEYQELSRRGFLSASRSAAAAVLSSPAWLPQVVLARDFGSHDTIVNVFLRGGWDSLSVIIPYGDPNYYSPTLRPDLTIAPPGSSGGAVALTGNSFFGLAPALASLVDAYDAGDLLLIPASGSPDPSRSHFDAQQFMEYGTPLQPASLFSGWLARHLQVVPPVGNGLLRAVAFADLVPQSLTGAPATVPVPNPAEYGFPGNPATIADRRAILEQTYASAASPLPNTAISTFGTIDLLATIDFDNYTPSNGAVYPNSSFGRALESAAALIKAEVGVEACTIDKGGWDTHNAQGNIGGAMFLLMQDLADGLAAFHLDMQSKMNELVVVVMSEFGRRADQNGSIGTDHGHGNAMMAMGGHIAGGQVIGDWTGGELLHPDNLFQGDSLDITTDYRDVLSEILSNRLGNNNLDQVFPNYTPSFKGVTV